MIRNKLIKEKVITPIKAAKHTNIATWVTKKKDTDKIGNEKKFIAPSIDRRRHTPIAVHSINTTSKHTTMTLQKAISSGARHGVELEKEKLNAAKGSFPFEKATKLGNSSQVVMTPPPSGVGTFLNLGLY